MYKSVYYEKGWKSTDPVKTWIWDDQEKEVIHSEIRTYAYAKDVCGEYTSIYGDKLKKIEDYAYGDPNLFESDVPTETFILREVYGDSDEVSTGHHV